MAKLPSALDLNELVAKSLSTDGTRQLLDWVAQHSWWVPQQVYQKVPVVYPKTRRAHGVKESRGKVVNGIRLWNNEPAIEAFWRACAKSPNEVKNYYICHIYEDSVHSPLHFTNLANLTAFPKSLQSLSEWGPVAAGLKYHSFMTYGYTGPIGIKPPKPDYYPSRWDRQLDLPTETLNQVINRLEEQRRKRPQFRNEENVL